MHSQAFLAALLATTAAGAPFAPKAREPSSTDPLSALSSLLGGLGGGAIPTTLPTGLPGGLGGGGSLSGTPALPTGLPGGLGGGSSTEGGVPAYPTGLLGGLGSSGSSSSSTDKGAGLLSGLIGSGSSSNKKQRRQLGTSTSSGGSALTSLLSGLGGSGTSTTSGGSSLASLLSGFGGSSSTDSSSTDSSSADSSTSGLGSLLGGSSTENGLANACKAVTVIFARGTTETGNMGTIVGPGLTTDVESALNNDVNVQGVDYAADAAGIASEALGPGTGSDAMIADVQEALSKCPDTQIVLSGYSQGAMLVHNTMGALNTTAAASVKACVTFGDPFVGEAIKNFASADWKSFCATDDPVCDSGAAMSPASGGTTSASTLSHLGYGADTQTAATFIKGKVTI